jgi:hypothetical protein
MKRFLVELDDALARELERAAPARSRKRADFVRSAIRHALDVALDRSTASAYAAHPLAASVLASDLSGWDEANLLRRAEGKRSRRAPARKRAA